MYTLKQLDDAFNEALSIVNFPGGFDTFKFRKGVEEITAISFSDKKEVMAFLNLKLPRSSDAFKEVKERIDKEEFLFTDYYANPYPRKFRGAYYPVVVKTFAGIMALSLK